MKFQHRVTLTIEQNHQQVWFSIIGLQVIVYCSCFSSRHNVEGQNKKSQLLLVLERVSTNLILMIQFILQQSSEILNHCFVEMIQNFNSNDIIFVMRQCPSFPGVSTYCCEESHNLNLLSSFYRLPAKLFLKSIK